MFSNELCRMCLNILVTWVTVTKFSRPRGKHEVFDSGTLKFRFHR